MREVAAKGDKMREGKMRLAKVYGKIGKGTIESNDVE